MNRPRLLVLSHDYTLTGAPIALFTLCSGLTDQFDLLVASPIDGPLRHQFAARGIHALVLPDILSKPDITEHLMLSFDAVLANTILSYAAVHAAARHGKPSVWYLHEGHAWTPFFAEYPQAATAMRRAAALVVPCRFSAELYRPWRDPPATIVPYGVDTRQPAPRTDAADHIRVLQLGTFDPRKGQDIALEAMRLLTSENIVLGFFGRIEKKEYHRHLREKYADLRQIRYHGEVPLGDTPTVLASCDILIVPSRDEVTPMVILEAMAMAKPVIAAGVGGIPEMITDGKTGFLFNSDDAGQLAALIRRVGRDAALREAVGRQAQAFVRGHRTLAQYRDGFTAIFRKLAAGQAVPIPAAG
jgi:O-antigen biosynthesis protein